MNTKDNEREHTCPRISRNLNSSLFSQFWQFWFHRETIVRNLEFVQDLVVVSLCIGLFCVMLIRLGEMFLSLLEPINFQAITSDILFILILVEIFRLLVIYLQEQRISIGAAVEVSLVSALREIILEGVLEVPLNNLLGACVFLVVLGGLLFLRVWMFQQFDAVRQVNNGGFMDSQDSKARPTSGFEQYPF